MPHDQAYMPIVMYNILSSIVEANEEQISIEIINDQNKIIYRNRSFEAFSNTYVKKSGYVILKENGEEIARDIME